MLTAILATLLFATSSVSAKKSVQLFGSSKANLLRLALATSLLGICSHIWGVGLRGPSWMWFVLSGLIGYGVCDTALFLALPRLGAQLTSLMVQCLAAPVAAATEWLWLGTRLGPPEIFAGLLILVGVVVALLPSAAPRLAANPGAGPRPGAFAFGMGVLAASGQGIGAVLSRHGQSLSRKAGFPIDPLSVTYQRILAGLAFAFVWWWLGRQRRPNPPTFSPASRRPTPSRAALWVTLNAVCGPFLGTICYQWALQRHPTGIVLSITSLTPLAVVPLAWWIDGEPPRARSIAGGCLAVCGVLGLALRR